MSKTNTYILFSLLLAILMTFLLEWPFSPLNKAIAWTALKTGRYTTIEQSGNYVKTLLGGSDLTPEKIKTLPFFSITDTTKEITDTTIPFSVLTFENTYFPKDFSYLFPSGQDGIYETEAHTLLLDNREVANYLVKGKVLREPITQIVYNGSKEHTPLIKELETNWKTLATALTKKEKPTAERHLTAAEYELLSKTTALSDLSYRLDASIKISLEPGLETDISVQVGTVEVKQKNCTVTADIPILFLKDQQLYVFDKVYTALASLCAKPKATSGLLNCSNCWLAPVSKQFSLRSSYIPYVVSTGLNGGGYVTPDTKKALAKLFTAAKENGVTSIRVSSSYRSYKTQESLFNSYVNNEKKNGLSTTQAIEKANTYSAKPGYSEHQLGTTVDLMACAYPCNFYDSANTPLYNFLKKNAHLYGFVISYPNGSQPYTGYVYEPWHVRYIGETYARELYNRGYLTKKGFYLYQFLVEKGKY